MVDEDKRTGPTGYYFADKRRTAHVDCPKVDDQVHFLMLREMQSQQALSTQEPYGASNDEYEARLLQWFHGRKI